VASTSAAGFEVTEGWSGAGSNRRPSAFPTWQIAISQLLFLGKCDVVEGRRGPMAVGVAVSTAVGQQALLPRQAAELTSFSQRGGCTASPAQCKTLSAANERNIAGGADRCRRVELGPGMEDQPETKTDD
jgi:hypothetical protein